MLKKIHRRFVTPCICLLLVSAMMLCATSCALQISAAELSAGYSRGTDTAGEVSGEFVAAMAEFSMSLFKGIITKDGENDLVSPLSAIICLAMIANGADGETKTQMEAAFGMETDALNESLYAYTASLYSADNCKVNIADSIWFRDGDGRLHVNEEFLQTNADWYDAQIYAAPFDESTLRDINNWCKKSTDGMIEEMIDTISTDAVMYLINALTFDAKWAEKYEKDDIRDRIFTNYDSSEVSVQMLYSNENVYLSGEGVSGFAKDYMGDAYSFVALLPDDGVDIYDSIAALDGAAWLALWSDRQNTTVSAGLPEFTYSAQMNLNDVLISLGMVDMFNSDANFSRLGYSETGNIYCSEVAQKVFIEVDRNGTRAAAITWGTMDKESGPPNSVILDRPFVYAIVDNATGLPLFVGAVTMLDGVAQ